VNDDSNDEDDLYGVSESGPTVHLQRPDGPLLFLGGVKQQLRELFELYCRAEKQFTLNVRLIKSAVVEAAVRLLKLHPGACQSHLVSARHLSCLISVVM